MKYPFIENIDKFDSLIHSQKIKLLYVLLDISVEKANKRLLERNRGDKVIINTNYQDLYLNIFKL